MIRAALCLAIVLGALPGLSARAEETPAAAENPYVGQPAALEEAERLYRSRCIGCHYRAGGRGPNLFRTKLTLARFVEIVAKGGGPGMPAWGTTLSGDDILKLHALVSSRDRL